MTQALAVANAKELRHALLKRGVETVSIELVEGRGGSGWVKLTHVASMGHHTVSRRSNGLTPCLKLVKVGRPDVLGPLCNGYGGFDEVARIICMAWANHPGEGGPYKVAAGTVPVNNGRPYFFGWEFEGGIVEADFTPSYRRFMAACLAGTLDWLGRDTESHAEHKTWAPGRKVDRLGYTLDKARQEIKEGGALTLLQARLEVATAWHQKSGVWMTPQPPETAQGRLTRLSLEVLRGERTPGAIALFAPQKDGTVVSEPVPSWVFDGTVPSP